MSQSSEPPPEPNPWEVIQNDVAKFKRLQGLDVNRLALGSEVEGIVPGGLFGSIDYTITGVNVIEFVNVSTSLGPAQGSSGIPAQVTGLTVTPHAGSDTQLDLTWTATSLPAEFNYYTVYRGPTGFTVGPSFIIANPVTNSYNNTGLTAGTTYYYRVSLTNDALLEGLPSSQVSGTTTGIAPISPDFLLHLDNNFTDSSVNAVPIDVTFNGNGFGTPGVFGSHYWKCNSPVETPGGFSDRVVYDPVPTALAMDTTVGFSISLWIYPTDISALASRRPIVEHMQDSSNQWSLQISSSGIVYFFVKKAGTDYKREISGFTTGSWQHIAATFNGATNTVALYRNGTAGSASVQTTQYSTNTDQWIFGARTEAVLPFEGYFDEIQYFKGYVLSSTQVTNLMNTNAT